MCVRVVCDRNVCSVRVYVAVYTVCLCVWSRYVYVMGCVICGRCVVCVCVRYVVCVCMCSMCVCVW